MRGARAVLQLYPENSEQVSLSATRGAGKGRGPEQVDSSYSAPHSPALLLLGSDRIGSFCWLVGKGENEYLRVAPDDIVYDLISQGGVVGVE